MKRLLILPLLPLLLIFTGCTSTPHGLTETGQIRHIVILWLKPGVDATPVIASMEELRQIPGVIEVGYGRKLASERSVVDSSYDLALVMSFDSEASLRAYDEHPIHKKLVEDVIKPNAAKLAVYDSTIDAYSWGKTVDDDLAERRRKAWKEQQNIVDRKR